MKESGAVSRGLMEKNLILIIDDSPEIRLLLQAELNQSGYRTASAESGEEGLELAKDLKPSLILLDVRLPGIDGHEVCRRLKSAEETSIIPVVQLTALAETAERIKGLESGADDFLSKPFHRAELLARVRSLLRIRELWLQRQQAEIDRVNLELELDRERERTEHEARVRRVYADAISAVSNGKLQLLEAEELAAELRGDTIFETRLENGNDISRVRKELGETLEGIGFEEEARDNLVLAASEAFTNAVQHAGGGDVKLRFDGEAAQVVIADHGHGIDFSLLPKATLWRGFSTKASLGLGFTFMLELCSRVLLCTNEEGTIIGLETNPALAGAEPELGAALGLDSATRPGGIEPLSASEG